MKTKIWTRIAFYSLLFGWFPFMWLSVWGSWNKEYGVYILLLGLGLCIFGSMMILPLLKNNDLFKSIEELEDERIKYFEAKQKLERKILKL